MRPVSEASKPSTGAASAVSRSRLEGIRLRLWRLYYSPEQPDKGIRYAFFAFDVAAILYFMVTTITNSGRTLIWLDVAIGLVYLADFCARAVIAANRRRFFLRFATLTDVIVLVSLIGSAFVVDLAFLRILRILRILRSYHLIEELAREWPVLRLHEELIQAALNLFSFVFVVTSIVFLVEEGRNEEIRNWFDALYYTVSTLTTTGFGDIVVTDTAGRLVTVAIMVLGVALFLRLLQTNFRPPKVYFPCPTCGLERHDPDAIHCKHCGTTIRIETEGER
jgi:voltage-gated potassium channel